jgi:transposase
VFSWNGIREMPPAGRMWVVLRSLSGEFDSLYSSSGRPSIAPEYVLRAPLLQAILAALLSGSWSSS